jgi:hypothetical protein
MAVYRAKGTLRTIVPQMQGGTFDFLEWRLQNPYAKNALVLLGMLGAPIPPDLPLHELNGVALRALHETAETERTKTVVAHMYGLVTGAPINGREVARITGINEPSVHRDERLFIRRLAERRENRTD